MFTEVQSNLFTEELNGEAIMSRVNRVERFDGDIKVAANLLDTFHEGALMVTQAVPNIVTPTPLWVGFGSAPSPYYTVPPGLKVKPAVVVTTSTLEYLSRLPQEENLPLEPGVVAGSLADFSYTPQELMLAAGVEESHHAIVARFIEMNYGIGLGPVSPNDDIGMYLAQEVEWQAARFVLEALRIKGVSAEAVAAHQRRLDAAKEFRKILGLQDFFKMPLLKEFLDHHSKTPRNSI